MKNSHRLILIGILTSHFLFLLPLVSSSQSPGWLWANEFGESNDDEALSIVTNTAGNVYTTGHFSGTVDFNPGVGVYNLTSFSSGSFISKLDPSGNFLWAKAIEAWSYSITLDALGNVYVTGYFWGTKDFDPNAGIYNMTATGFSDIFILKLSSSGNFVWANRMGGSAFANGLSISVDSTTNIYTTGYFSGTVDFDPGAGTHNITAYGDSDVFIAKLNSAGNLLWAKNFGGTGLGIAYSIACDPVSNGDVYATGYFTGTADFDPGPGVYNLVCSSSIYPNTFVLKLNSSGNLIWAKVLGGGDIRSKTLAVDPTGNRDVCFGGSFKWTVDFDPGTGTYPLTSSGNEDIFISRLDSSGTFVWAKAMGGTAVDAGNCLVIDPFGNIYVTGFFQATADFDPGPGTFNLTSPARSPFITKADSNGNLIWAKSALPDIFGVASSDNGKALTLNSSGHVFVCGYFTSSSIIFGPAYLLQSGGTDAFIAKLDTAIVTSLPTPERERYFSMYPNPVTSEFVINQVNWNKNLEISILDYSGRQVFRKTYGDSKVLKIDTRDFAQGVYTLRIIFDDAIENWKFIIAK